MSITTLPTSSSIIIGQAFSTYDGPFIMLRAYQGGNLRLFYGGATSYQLTKSSLLLGTPFSFTIKVTNSTIYVQATQGSNTWTMPTTALSAAYTDMYFKSGAYFQPNTTLGTTSCELTISSLSVTHV
jgi:hypothetical protein